MTFSYHEICSERLRIRYQKGNSPYLVWLPGFLSSCASIKVDSIFDAAVEKDLGFVSFDYSCHGDSSGDIANATISDWIAQADAVINKFIGAQERIYIGSSMGGWIALNLLCHAAYSQNHAKHAGGAIMIAPAVNMTMKIRERVAGTEFENDLAQQGYFLRPSQYGDDPYHISEKLLKHGEKWVLGPEPLNLDIPVHIIHGAQDEDVPLDVSRQLMHRLVHCDAHLSVIPDGEHRLSRPQDIILLRKILDQMIQLADKRKEI